MTGGRRAGRLDALVCLGPASLALGLALLASAAWLGFFAHGPGVPTAGRSEGWTVVWLVLGIVLLGHAAGLVASAALLVLRGRGAASSRLRAAVLVYDVVAAPLLLVGLCAP